MPRTAKQRIALFVGILCLLAAAPCWMKHLEFAFAYSAWVGLDPNKFPIAAVQQSAREWMVLAVMLQIIGIALTDIALRVKQRELLYISLIPASFLPTLLLVSILMTHH